MNLKNIAIITISVISMTVFNGCFMDKTFPPKTIKINKELKVKENFKFIDKLQKVNISKEDFTRRLINFLKNNSKVISVEDDKRSRKDSYSRTFTRGIILKYNNDILNIKYITGKKGSKSENRRITSVSFDVPLKITKNGDNYFTVEATYPKKYIYIESINTLGMTLKPIRPISQLKKDVERIIKSLKYIKLTEKQREEKIKGYSTSYLLSNYKAIRKSFIPKLIKINRSFEIKGEVDSKYSMDSTFSNLNRILKLRDEDKELSKISAKYKHRINKNKSNKAYINFDVYPYKNGSKVIYEGNIEYMIDSQGESSLTPSDIENFKQKVKDAVKQ